ncbi:imidazolonepropionase [Galbibacter pacificus]|uniref:Imidazolonepropionase n=1 Tax=Galbibacter pacificus TaxID=2996052 RepID=A0ABT6FQ26_9FLAO|nr:imidazolonepropionase [Galbibacter pacificus]MDG3582335.1 imidazolonepropionase [Galbibacter pacificus]MDG3585189.1 imidazolonepropionase [Galbibacter pacificus]
MKRLFINIKELLQVREANILKVSGKDMKVLPSLKNAFLLVEGDTIAAYGTMGSADTKNADEVIDATGKTILPTWCDSHTHLVYAGNREQEFVDRINGLTYEEIANKGGGILNSAKTLQQTLEEELYEQSRKRLENVMKLGTGAIEIKSGYGLTAEAEIKMLNIIKKLKENYPATIKSTFLGAHAVPENYKNNKDGYVQKVIDEILPEVGKSKLADYIDVFCEKGYFSVADMEAILEAAKTHGLTPKVHVNQFNAIGGIQAAVKHRALTVDHLEVMPDEDIEALKNTGTMPVGLPLCSYFLSIPYAPGRKLIEAGLPFVLATDYNPGSSPSGNMNQVVAAACIKMKLTPAEAINAATINGAHAMGVSRTHGSITKGKKANIILTKEIPSYGFLPYDFGNNNIDKVMINGEFVS